MSDLPEGWVWANLGEIGNYINGRGFKKAEWTDHGLPIIRIQNLTGTSKAFNSFSGDLEDRYRVPPGSLLVSWAASLGVYIWGGPEGALNQHIFRVESRIDSNFHRWLLDSALADLQRQSHGSGMVHITKGKFDSTAVPLPPLAEQRRIVAAVEAAMSKLEAGVTYLEAASRRADRLWAATLSAALLDGHAEHHSLPHGWDRVPLEELVPDRSSITDGPFGSNLKTVHYTENGPRVVRLQNIGDGVFRDEKAHISPTHFETLRKHEVLPGDILVASLGEELPRACVAPETLGPAIVKADCIRVRVRPEIEAKYVMYALNSPAVRRKIAEAIRGVGRPRINLRDIRALKIPLAPARVRPQIIQLLDATFEGRQDLQRSVGAETMRAASLRRSVLGAALSGRLVPQDPTDEPASLLLERITAEQAASAALTPRRRLSRPASGGLA